MTLYEFDSIVTSVCGGFVSRSLLSLMDGLLI